MTNGIRTISGVATSVTAFVGYAPSGPVNDPVHLFSVAEFERTFGQGDGDLCTAVRLFFINGGSQAVIVRVAPDEGEPKTADLIGAEEDGTGLFALEPVDLLNILVVPGEADPAVHAAMIAYADRRRAFAILDPPAEIDTPSEAEAWIGASQVPRSPSAAVYFPQLTCAHAAMGRSSSNSGAVAGIYARTDATRGVWTAPAGRDSGIRGIVGLQYPMTDKQSGTLNPLGINALRAFPDGTVVWGARTLAGADSIGSDWKYVPVRRLALFLEQSIERGIQWARFEPNDERLWAQLRLNVGSFLHGLFRQGAFKGRSPRDAYFVQCDRSTNPQADIGAGIVNILVGFAPLKPAEFIIIRFRIQGP